MPEVLQNVLTYAGSFVLVLSVVVFVHEFGHFQVARWRGVAIDTFSIGFGKTLFGWRDKQGVHWKVGALPLGGYVKFADDADAMSTGPREKLSPEQLAQARAQGLFHAQPLSTRALVVAAGPFTNFVFSILAFAAIALMVGRDVTDIDSIPARVAGIASGSAAEAAGLRAGDVIREADGAQIGSFADLQAAVSNAADRAITLQVVRRGEPVSLTVTPASVQGRGVLGVSGPLVLPEERQIEQFNAIEALGAGASQTWNIIAQTGAYIGAIFAGRENGDQIAGPLGIINVSGQVASSALGGGDTGLDQRLRNLGLALLSLAAVLSVAVGFVNLLPIPILDGGHLLFYAIEGVRGGRPLPEAAQEWAYRAGFAVMASLFLFATWNDITRLLPGAN
ncbi:MAG: RIP metalloprotease [Hyphomonadaceae bacterium]|nr:RIP metalloprotease [Hyphomonadaceae bacterium]